MSARTATPPADALRTIVLFGRVGRRIARRICGHDRFVRLLRTLDGLDRVLVDHAEVRGLVLRLVVLVIADFRHVEFGFVLDRIEQRRFILGHVGDRHVAGDQAFAGVLRVDVANAFRLVLDKAAGLDLAGLVEFEANGNVLGGGFGAHRLLAIALGDGFRYSVGLGPRLGLDAAILATATTATAAAAAAAALVLTILAVFAIALGPLRAVTGLVVAFVAQYVFGVWLGWVRPTVGHGAPWTELVLPAAVLACVYSARIVRLTRSSVIETAGMDFVRTARAHGLSGRRVVVVHVARSSLAPAMTALATDFGVLLAGATVTEGIFNVPGTGNELYRAIVRGEGATIVALVTVVVLLFLAVSLIGDVVNAALDPRVRMDTRTARGVGDAL